MERDYKELYEKITESDWFKKAYQDKSLGKCPIVVEGLEESKDEKIRKALIKDFRNYYEMYDKSCGEPKWGSDCLLVKDILDWLERKKEQKPAVYIPKFKVGDKVISIENTHLTYDILEVGLINELGKPDYRVEIFVNGKSGIPEIKKEHNIHLIDCQKMDSWAKLIEQKPTEWKPLEESMEALLLAIEGKWDAIKPTGYMSRRLEDLYDGLVNTFNIRETYLPKTNYTEKDIEELKTLKSKIDASMEQKPVERSEEDVIIERIKSTIEKYLPKREKNLNTSCIEFGMLFSGEWEVYDYVYDVIQDASEDSKEKLERIRKYLRAVKDNLTESRITNKWTPRKTGMNYAVGDIEAAFKEIQDKKEQKPAECIEDSIKFKEGFKAGRESGLRDGQKYVLNNLDSYGLCKPAEWNAEDSRILYNVIAYVGYAAGQRGVRDDEFKEANSWLKSLPMGFIVNPNYNENMVNLLVGELQSIAERNGAPRQYDAEITWLKSLRPQSHWKPSEEQMGALNEAINTLAASKHPHENDYLFNVLNGLRENLKKL